MTNLETVVTTAGRTPVHGVPEGFDALALARLHRAAGSGPVLHVARDDSRMAALADALGFFAPELSYITFPAWDCVPYDRVPPHADIMARRIGTLAMLADGAAPDLVLTTASAATQRVPPLRTLVGTAWTLATGGTLDQEAFTGFLERNGYHRAETVMEPGEYAVRGGIMDVFPSGHTVPVRLDLFGDEIDTLRTFDPHTQRTIEKVDREVLHPMSEVVLDDAAVSQFRSQYRALFGTPQKGDELYEAISAGRKFPGMEHWLPLFHEHLETLFAYLPDTLVVALDHETDQAVRTRREQIREYYDARRTVMEAGGREGGMIYNPVPPDRLYVPEDEWNGLLAVRRVAAFSPYAAPDAGGPAVDLEARPGRDFADVRAQPGGNVYDAVAEQVRIERTAGRRSVIAAYSEGSRDRLASVLSEHGVPAPTFADSWPRAEEVAAEGTGVPLVVLTLERGFRTPDLALIAEQDILGDRLVRRARRRRKPEQMILDAGSLNEGDLVVHQEHGIGRYEGLVTVEVAGAAHDCLRLVYDGDDRLMVPVENLDLLSRYGTEESGVQLDRLGSTAWQARKAKLKERIREMADHLVHVAAERQVRTKEPLNPPEGLYEEFANRFPWVETDDQLQAIEQTVNDLSSGRPMDRLVCGDVGFGKTEVALRAAFVTAMAGYQVAVVVPTTLLARQHHQVFRERFDGFPVKVEQLSRMVSQREAQRVRKGLKDGTVDIVVGTHALLTRHIQFDRLNLVVVDEEQHFGVAHKERLKQLKSGVHVLTMTATPIPRTLQMALTGIRDMSIIATPPVDRLAVRTFVLPYDPVVVREAILRERFRGGQTFYVCPRVADLETVHNRIADLVPEVRVAVAHGQMAASDLEEVMGAFGDGEYDVLVCTNIIESGLDMPRVNTILIHRSDMFGLAQLYQLRGRVGRSKARGYAYLTLPSDRRVNKTAHKRLEVMQTLDSLGAGFSLASYDLDIRGAGNLLGEEQSGHIREVGVELYQQMLQEAVEEARSSEPEGGTGESWSPQISLGSPVLIPEDYVPDLGVRLSLYRRAADLTDPDDIEAFGAELVDRFGPLPQEVENLLEVVAIKRLCRLAGAEKVDAGPKGAVVTFRNNTFANPAGLVEYIDKQAGTCKLRPDHKLVFKRGWETEKQRIQGLKDLLTDLSAIAAQA